MNSEFYYAWAAGIFDGEGHLGIQYVTLDKKEKTYYRAVLSVGNTDKKMIDRLQQMFGGSISERLDKRWDTRVFYSWRALTLDIEGILLKVLPYLVTKKEQARILIELRKRTVDGKPGCHAGMSDDEKNYRAVLCERVQTLNSGKAKEEANASTQA